MKTFLIVFLCLILLSGVNNTDNCDLYKKEAIYWQKMYNLQDSCISLMDFKTAEAKRKVLMLYAKMMELTLKK